MTNQHTTVHEYCHFCDAGPLSKGEYIKHKKKCYTPRVVTIDDWRDAQDSITMEEYMLKEKEN